MTETQHEPDGGGNAGAARRPGSRQHGMSHAVAEPHGATTDHGEDQGHDDHAHGSEGWADRLDDVGAGAWA
jgi:hypothetical protein